ncbi:MAG: XisH family protein [Bacteroidota bacterium]
MSAKDKYHDVVRAALEKDGWVITDDPLRLRAQGRNIKIDLGAEQIIAAEKGPEKIAVEVKSFIGLSVLSDFYLATGQFLYYRSALADEDPERELYLAVPDEAFDSFFSEALTQTTIQNSQIKLIVYNVEDETLVQWTTN